MLKKIIFILLFIISFVITGIYANEIFPVQKGELFNLSFPSSRMKNKYYITDFNRKFLSYYGNEYFPATDEAVYYFKPLREGVTELKIIKNINGDRSELIYQIVIHDVSDELMGYSGTVLSPKLKLLDSTEKTLETEPVIEYENLAGFMEMELKTINRKVKLIYDLFNNEFYENAIEESQKLFKYHLIKGIREEITYLVAESYLKLNNQEQAIDTVKTLNNYEDMYINRSRIEYFKGKVYFDIQDYNNSMLTLLRLINIFDDEEYILKGKYMLAETNNNIGRLENAINQLNEIIIEYPGTETRAKALYLLGGIYENELSRRDYYKAADYYRLLYNEYPDLEISDHARKKSSYIRKNFF